MTPITLGLLETLAIAALGLLLGREVIRRVPVFNRLCLPEPVLGGLVLCVVLTLLQAVLGQELKFDLSLQTPFMIAFFLSVGWMASWKNLKAGGPEVLRFLVLSSVILVVQNAVGMLLAGALGQPALLGVLAGSVSLTGGPGTALAFAPAFEKAGITGAAPIGTACALAGIVMGGLLGAPLSSFLVRRVKKSSALEANVRQAPAHLQEQVEQVEHSVQEGEATESLWDSSSLRTHLKFFLLVMAVGSLLGQWMQKSGLTLPIYIGSMLVAAAFRNVQDYRAARGESAIAGRASGFSSEAIDEFGSICLSYFLVVATMTLQLRQLADLAGVLVLILVLQAVVVLLVAWGVVFRFFGKDYDAAVMAGGFVGFMLGTTANAMANMRAISERHGKVFGNASRAFVVVPLVGACFIDFINAMVITFLTR